MSCFGGAGYIINSNKPTTKNIAIQHNNRHNETASAGAKHAKQLRERENHQRATIEGEGFGEVGHKAVNLTKNKIT